jgi:hypothetical protein
MSRPKPSKSVQGVCREIRELGGVVDRIDLNKHAKIFYSFGRRKFVQVCASTPTDWRAEANNRATLRRNLLLSKADNERPQTHSG